MIKKFLLENKIYPNKKGYRYLIEAVKIAKGADFYKIKKVMNICKQVGEKFGATTSSVEHSMRRVLKVLDKDVCKQYGIRNDARVGELIFYFAELENEENLIQRRDN